MTHVKLTHALLGITLGAVLLAGCGKTAAADSGKKSQGRTTHVVAVGSTALQPLVEQAASAYTDDHPEAHLTVQGGGSGAGLSSVAQGDVAIGNSDIFAKQQSGIDASKLRDHRVAVVGMTPVVNQEVGVKKLSMKQLRQIFSGKITNWKQVGGKSLPISVVNRAAGSGTRATFEAAVMAGQKTLTTQEQDSSGTVAKIVASTPGAISYLAFSYVKKDVQPLTIDGVAPNAANVTTGAWPIWSYEHMYTKAKPAPGAAQFIAYVKSTAVQKTLVKKLGYISINAMHVTKGADNRVHPK